MLQVRQIQLIFQNHQQDLVEIIHSELQCHVLHKERHVLQEIIHLVQVAVCHVHHNDQFAQVNNHVQVVDQVVLVDLADNVQDLQRVHNKVDLADNVQDLQRVHNKVEVHVHKVAVQVELLHIVQVQMSAVAHQVVKVVQVDLIAQVNVLVQVVAEIPQVHLVKVDQRRVIIKRVRKLCVMISKTCKHLLLAA